MDHPERQSGHGFRRLSRHYRDQHEWEHHLDATQLAEAITREKISASVIHESIRREGIKQLDRSAPALGWSGVAAGVSMGSTLLAVAVLHHALPESPWRPAVASLGYPLGFLAVLLGSQQLFTENTLTPLVPLMTHRTREMLRSTLSLWAIVLLANVVGTLLFAWIAARTAVFPEEVRQAMRTVALESTSHDAVTLFARGIAAGWIVALMAWMLPGAHTSKVFIIIIMTWLIGAARLSHVIVNCTEAFYLAVLGDMSAWRALGGVIVPALLGNIAGGVALVAALNHAQVKTE